MIWEEAWPHPSIRAHVTAYAGAKKNRQSEGGGLAVLRVGRDEATALLDQHSTVV